MQIFTKVQYLCKRLQIAITLKQNFWDIIRIEIARDLLYNNFDTTTTSLLKVGNKIIDQIYSILQLRKAKNNGKRAIKAIRDPAIAFKDNKGPKKKHIEMKNTSIVTNQVILVAIAHNLIEKNQTFWI